MPSIDIHAAKSRQRTGKDYLAVHRWVDDPDHKAERHDITRVLEIARMFTEIHGEEAAREYVQHLADDLQGKFGHLMEEMQGSLAGALAYFGVRAQDTPQPPQGDGR